eukprot:230627-Pleurochrysis_carterae.AAC.2
MVVGWDIMLCASMSSRINRAITHCRKQERDLSAGGFPSSPSELSADDLFVSYQVSSERMEWGSQLHRRRSLAAHARGT